MNLDDGIKKINQEIEKTDEELQQAEVAENFKWTLKNYHGEDEVISFHQARENINNEKIPRWRAISQMPALEQKTGGFRPGELVVITAPTSQGKTTFAQTLTRDFYKKNNLKSLWFTYEVPLRDFLEKFKVDLPQGYVPKKLISANVLWIERKIIESIAKYDTKIVFIDHLHYLIDMSQIKNTSLEIGAIMRELKKMALKNEIVIFVIAHMTKTKYEDKVGLEDLRDSSFISQEADYVIVLWREREEQSKTDIRQNGIKYTDRAIVSVEKNRPSGRIGGFKVQMIDNFFTEVIKNEYGNF